MKVIREIYENAPEQLILTLPSDWRQQRVEVIILTLDESYPATSPTVGKRYRTLPVAQRLILPREVLHER
jgi:hypothetical protein